ncbi:MAG: thiol reductase thioredoxin, partial [Candidatus Sedimenticola endophacoides]
AFAEAARRLEPEVRLLKLNTEEHQGIAARLGIRSIPTLILFLEGRELQRMSGAMDVGGIVDWVRRLQ